MASPVETASRLPPRLQTPGIFTFLVYVLIAAFLISSFHQTEVSLGEFAKGIPQMGRLLGEMMPPSLERLGTVGTVLLLTFQMAVAGAAIGIVLAFLISIPASKVSQAGPFYYAARAVIAFCRTVPDLVW